MRTKVWFIILRICPNWRISHITPNLIILGQDGEYQTGHENDHEHRRIAGVGVFLTQGVSASRATSQDYEPTVSVKDYARPFFCKVCHIDCTSDNALEAHLIGKNHMKKLRQLGKVILSN